MHPNQRPLRALAGVGLAVACGLGILAGTPQPALAEEGWVQRGGETYYYHDNVAVTGEQLLQRDGISNWYYFENDGRMATGWKYLGAQNKWVYYDPSTGAMCHGERAVGGDNPGWCYFDDITGATTYGWKYVEAGKKWVYYDPYTGRMWHGEGYVSKDNATTDDPIPGWCYFDEYSGAVQYGWRYIEDSNKWVYYDPYTGRMWHGEGCVLKDDATTDDPIPGWCYFDDVTGATQYGWKRLGDNRVVYYDPQTGRMWHGAHVINDVAMSLDDATGAVNLGAQWIQGAHFNHGTKRQQKYIMLHDTEGNGTPANIASGWMQENGGAVAAHFVIGRDGSIAQCGGLDQILHHAGWGGPGDYDSKFGVGGNNGQGTGDDMYGVVPLSGYTSYGMNSYSIGIELVHVDGQGYPEAQLRKLDQVIAYIDAYYGYQSEIIRHRDWRPSNPDTEAAFDRYFENYKSLRRHS